MTCCRRSLALAVAIALLSAGAASAQNTAGRRADEQLARGQRFFNDGKYEDAIEVLRGGFVMSPQPRFLYALGQAYRLNHQCKEAVQAYRDFIKSQPSKAQVAAAESNIQRCASEDATSVVEVAPPKPEPPPQVAPPPEVVVAAPPPPPPPRRPIYKRWWLWTTVGVVIVGAGLGLGLGLGLRHDRARFDTTLPEVGPNANVPAAGRGTL